MRNWKTTLSGLVSSFALLVALSPDRFGGENSTLVTICIFITAGGISALGVNAEDAGKIVDRFKGFRSKGR